MKLSILCLSLLLSTSIYANKQLNKFLGDCAADYPELLLELKKDFLSSSIWNYDHDFEVEDVEDKVSIESSQEAKLLMILKDGQHEIDEEVVYLTPKFLKNTNQCDYIDYIYE